MHPHINAHIHIYMYTYMWRSEVKVRYLPFTFFDIESLSEPKTCYFGLTG